jgi:hypothetical protein
LAENRREEARYCEETRWKARWNPPMRIGMSGIIGSSSKAGRQSMQMAMTPSTSNGVVMAPRMGPRKVAR